MIQKRDRFGLGYKPDRCERERFLEEKKQKRIASFLGKEGESAKMDIPPLSSSFSPRVLLIPRRFRIMRKR